MSEEAIVHQSGANETSPSHSARLSEIRARLDAEDSAPKPQVKEPVERAAPAAPKPKAETPPPAADPAASSMSDRIAKLTQEAAQRRAERAASKAERDRLYRENQALKQRHDELQSKAARAERWETLSPAERMQLAADGLSPEEIAKSWQTIGSPEWQEAQRVRRELTEREKAMAARLEALEARDAHRSTSEQMRSAEQAFSGQLDSMAETFPLVAKMPRGNVIRLAHGEAEELASRGEEVTYEAILHSLERKARQLAASWGLPSADAAQAAAEPTESQPERRPSGRAKPPLTQRAAQERSTVTPSGKVSHKERMRRLLAREGGR